MAHHVKIGNKPCEECFHGSKAWIWWLILRLILLVSSRKCLADASVALFPYLALLGCIDHQNIKRST
jgi:hypothetical protein